MLNLTYQRQREKRKIGLVKILLLKMLYCCRLQKLTLKIIKINNDIYRWSYFIQQKTFCLKGVSTFNFQLIFLILMIHAYPRVLGYCVNWANIGYEWVNQL